MKNLWRGIFVFALLAYGYFAWTSPWLDTEARLRMETLQRLEKETRDSDLKSAAEAYWRIYPDVAQDAFFGRAGRMGYGGAREHYQRHGRFEGRQWPQVTP